MPAEAWSDFFVATAGAAAALAGLVIVAISVNVQRILEYSNLPSRAGATISAQSGRPLREAVATSLAGQVQFVLFSVAVILLLGDNATGLSWLAAAIISVFIVSMLNAWVLLVEILR